MWKRLVIGSLRSTILKQQCTCLSSSIAEKFGKAKDRLNQLKEDPGPEIKLKLYSLFKQSTDGKCTKERPGIINFVERAKWDAWSSLGNMAKEKAMESYVALVEQILKDQPIKSDAENLQSNKGEHPVTEGIKIQNANGVYKIILNRPEKLNAITWEMYEFWADSLRKADKDDSVKVAVVTGSGEYFCSGNDISNYTKINPNMTMQDIAMKGNDVLRNFVGSFIDFSKPLVAFVNGPAIGISVTTLALYDAVYASDNATFSTPFSISGLTPEGCSSYTFPRIFGSMKANEMVLFNRKLSADEAIGLVSKVFPSRVFHEEVAKIASEIASLPPQTLIYSKELLRGPIRETLHQVNKRECDRLMERWLSDEFLQSVAKFMNRKK